MAVTKTHPIKSTLKAAIDYILNPEKTDGKLLASSFGCGLETADIEFAWTREAAGDRGTHLGRHLIQSFAVGETTPEEAHKIGMELAGAVLGGKYEFVLTTHVDKDHLHNHLIFNAVSFVDYKKYHSNKQSYHFIRRTSDRICKEHGLSVVVPGQDRGKGFGEWIGMESVFDPSFFCFSLLSLSLFNCIGFSNVGFSCVGFSNVGFSNVGETDAGTGCGSSKIT